MCAARIGRAGPDATLSTATKAVGVLEDIGIPVETTGRRRDRAFSYQAYLDRLGAGSEIEGE